MAPKTSPPPFWHRLGEIATYPVRGAALAALACLTLASLLGYLAILGKLITLIIWLGAYKYSFEILRNTADGRMDAPEIVKTADNGMVWRFLVLHLLFLVAILAAAFFGGLPAALSALLVLALMQPAAIMSLAIDGSLPRAINPGTTLEMIARIGGAYFAVSVLLFVIQAAAATAGAWLGQLLPAVLGDLVVTFLTFWGLFAAFHLMGYLVYQYHEALGYEPTADRDALPTLADRDRDLIDQADRHVRDGDTAAALELLGAEVRSRAVGFDVHELYRRLLRGSGNRAAIEEHTRQYLNLLMLEKQDRRALGLLREALDASPDFVPLQLEHAEQLVERARLAGQAGLALDQALALVRRHPRDPSMPRWALVAATLLVERFGRDDEARPLLQHALARCEDPALKEKLEAALRATGAASG